MLTNYKLQRKHLEIYGISISGRVFSSEVVTLD